ncbi:UPF0280 family protein [Methanothermococcus sp. SCGC AD-155-E23]|nr:UPF0280 family protein [Methanothermococcus sp. SCGC AD-155-E23]
MMSKKISIRESNILIKTENRVYIEIARSILLRERLILEHYIRRHPEFLTSYEPLEVEEDAPRVVKLMARSGWNADVGPMAAVAGSISQIIVEEVSKYGCRNIISNNGGDIALRSEGDVVVGLYAGNSPLSDEIGFKIDGETEGYGVCTSSGTVGHSVSFGNADAVVVFAEESSIADGAATSIGNFAVGSPEEAINKCLERAECIEGIDGVFVVVGEYAGKVGRIPKLVKTDKKVTYGELFEMI